MSDRSMSEVSEEWVRTHLLDSIYLNEGDAIDEIQPFRELPKKKVERVLPRANKIIHAANPPSITDQILSIMLSTKVRRGSRSLIESHLSPIRAIIERCVEHQQPISFVLPSLPFKDQSPFTTGAAIDHADLGEYCFFAQLKRIVEAITEIYNPGAHFTVLCDGFVYADIFAQGNKDGAGRYKVRCETIKNHFALYNQVTLFDMREVLFDHPEWPAIHDQVLRIILGLSTSDPEVTRRISTLAKKFKYHVQLSKLSYEEAREVYRQNPWPKELTDQLTHSAVLYSALQLTLKHTGLVHRAFPAAVRCTVHPKPAAQLPLHLTNPDNKLLPYNGVATVSRSALRRGKSFFEAVRIQRLMDVFRDPTAAAVYVESESDPYYYEVE